MKGIYYLIQYLKNHRKIYFEFKKYLNNNIYLSDEMIHKYINEDINYENKLEFITNENNKQKIISELKNALEQISIKLNETDVFLSLGLINIISENYNLAKENFLKAVKLNENDYSLWNRIGVVCQNENKIGEAISYYNKAIEINKNYPRCLINLGIAFFTLEDYFSSIKYFISALKLNKEIPEVWNYLTSIFISLEREDLLNLVNKKDLNGINQILF
jgi:tetratricopeptide (TPR) repeat protein